MRAKIDYLQLEKLKKGDVIPVLHCNKVRKAKVLNNFQAAKRMDIKIYTGWPKWLFFEKVNKEYDWNGFGITVIATFL